MRRLDRAGFLSAGVGAGAPVALGGEAVVTDAPVAAAAGQLLSDLDLDLARAPLSVGTEVQYFGAVRRSGRSTSRRRPPASPRARRRTAAFSPASPFGQPIGNSFPATLDYAAVADAMSPYFG